MKVSPSIDHRVDELERQLSAPPVLSRARGAATVQAAACVVFSSSSASIARRARPTRPTFFVAMSSACPPVPTDADVIAAAANLWMAALRQLTATSIACVARLDAYIANRAPATRAPDAPESKRQKCDEHSDGSSSDSPPVVRVGSSVEGSSSSSSSSSSARSHRARSIEYAHLQFLIVGQTWDRGQQPVLDERVVSILRWLDENTQGIPKSPENMRERWATHVTDGLVDRFLQDPSQPGSRVQRTACALCTTDFGCVVRVLDRSSQSYVQDCADFLQFVRDTDTLTLDTERSPVLPKAKGCHECHLVQLGTHEQVTLIPVAVFQSDKKFVQDLAAALKHRTVQHWGGDDVHEFEWAADLACAVLQCRFVNVQPAGQRLKLAVEEAYRGRTLCKLLTNSVWSAAPLSAGQVEYAAMDVVAAHAIVARVPVARRRVFVKNWPYRGSRRELEEGLQSFGRVVDVDWLKSDRNNRQPYAAFVTFDRSESAHAAVGSPRGAIQVLGRTLSVEWPNTENRR